MSVFMLARRLPVITTGAALVIGTLTAAAPVVASGAPQPAASTTAEEVVLAPWMASGPGIGSIGTVQLPGKPTMELAMRLRDTGTYTDVHFSTSQPGSAKECTMARLTASRMVACDLDITPLAAGETRTFTVTLWGKRDGVAFRTSTTKKIHAADVRVQDSVNGQVVGDNPVNVAGTTATLRREVTNRSGMTLRNLMLFQSDAEMFPTACRIAEVKPGATAACQFTLTRGQGSLSVSPLGDTIPMPSFVADGATGWKAYLATGRPAFRFVAALPGTNGAVVQTGRGLDLRVGPDAFRLDEVTGGTTETLVRAGRNPYLTITMEPGNETFTDVHYSTSVPGSAPACAARLQTVGYRVTQRVSCPVTIAPLKAGELRTYRVTVTGKRDGVPFTQTVTHALRGHAVDAKVYVDGVLLPNPAVMKKPGQDVEVRYVVTNRGTVALQRLGLALGLPHGMSCGTRTLAPGQTTTCTYTQDPRYFAENPALLSLNAQTSAGVVGALTMWDGNPSHAA